MIRHVVPLWNPEGEGVSAYAAALIRVQTPGREVTGGGPGAFEPLTTPRIEPWIEGGRFRLEEDPDQTWGPIRALLLHYVGYGYGKRGAPTWLATRWERLKTNRRRSPISLGVMFHEVAALGPPWTSSFWLHLLQLRIARRLLRASDLVVTSLDRYARLLGVSRDAPSVEVIGVPSTVGEPPRMVEYSERASRLVVFGSAAVRGRAWSDHREDLAKVVEGLGLAEVVDVGREAGAPDALAGRRVTRLGVAAPAEVSELLASSRAGFVAYPPDYLGKSTVYAAYAAHGVLPVCAWRGRQARSPRLGEAWVESHRIESPAEVAKRAFERYSDRRVAKHVEAWSRLLEKP